VADGKLLPDLNQTEDNISTLRPRLYQTLLTRRIYTLYSVELHKCGNGCSPIPLFGSGIISAEDLAVRNGDLAVPGLTNVSVSSFLVVNAVSEDPVNSRETHSSMNTSGAL